MALTAVSGQALASDFSVLMVGALAFGISGLLIIQALIGIVLVVDRRYISKDPALFIGTAAAFLLIGTLTVLNEAAHLASVDLIGLLAVMFVPGAVAILPPLIQRTKRKR